MHYRKTKYQQAYERMIPTWFIMPQKIINLTMVNADIEIKEQTEYSESMRHLIT